MEYLDLINDFFARYESIAKAFYTFTIFIGSVVGTVFAIYRIIDNKKAAKNKVFSEIFLRLKELEKDMNHINNPDTGRIHKTMALCESLIESNADAVADARAALAVVNAKST